MTTRVTPLFAIILSLFCSCENGMTETEVNFESNDVGIDEQNLEFIDELYQVQGGAKFDSPSVDLNGLISRLEKVDLFEKKTVAEIPNFFISFLQSKDPGFSMASPGENWQVGCVSFIGLNENGETFQKPLPTSQLAYFGLYENIALLAYYSGGIGRSESILIFKFNDTAVTEFWSGRTHGEFTDKESLLTCLKRIDKENSSFVPPLQWCSY